MLTGETPGINVGTMNTDTTILILDDEPALAEMYDIWLRELGVTRVANTLDEMKRQMDDSVDLVFLDRRLRHASGEEVLLWIRAEGFDCSVVMISAVDESVGMDIDYDRYLTKPVLKDEITKTAQQFIKNAPQVSSHQKRRV